MIASELADLPKGSKVLDVGIGTALTSAPVANELGLELSAVDISQSMLARAAERLPAVELKLGSATHIPFADNLFDAVLSNFVLKYVDLKDTDKVVSEMSRVAKNNSRVLVSDLALPALRPRFVHPLQSLDNKVIGLWSDKPRFIEAMKKEGFELVKTRHPLLSFLMVFQRTPA
jgi:ubiquinone/menaquinone biosynthesis C-methylase UbiE